MCSINMILAGPNLMPVLVTQNPEVSAGDTSSVDALTDEAIDIESDTTAD